ncbi:unnamed protein product, partial [Didymodactylos carnosus]
VYEHEKQQLGERTNLISLGNLLDDMGEYEKGHRYFEKVLHELVADSPDISKCYEGLGSIVAHRGDYNSALALYNKALEQDLKTIPSNNPKIADDYNRIAVVYDETGRFELALQYYDSALKIYVSFYGEDHVKTSYAYNNIGVTLWKQKRYSRA